MIERRTSGILLHITSLPSEYGIGDLGPEAYRFARFLAAAGQGIWQVLPLGPTETAFGNSPYSAPSAFAGNPLLLSPRMLCDGGFLTKPDLHEIRDFSPSRVDYPKVTRFKERLHSRLLSRLGPENRSARAFEQFCSENEAWLRDYADFAAVRKESGGLPWNRWPAELRDRDEDALRRWRAGHGEEIRRQKFLQFLFFNQWTALRRYCNDHGIRILGDVPIYVPYDSADVWSHPELFRLDSGKNPVVVAGVPPDYFSETGQLWGNPIYRWDALKETGYAWWIDRIRHSLKLFDLVRLDHFRGFAGYWEVPADHTTALEGRWVPGPGDDFFNALKRHFPAMPFIAEDLGEITPDVHELRDRFGLPGMRILQFAFGNGDTAHPYQPHNYIANCVAYTGTHDNDTLIGWIRGRRRVSTQRWSDVLKERENAFRYLGVQGTEKDIHWMFIRPLMMSAANLVLFPMQDILGLGGRARMNRPSTLKGNWEWRVRKDQLSREVETRLREMAALYERR